MVEKKKKEMQEIGGEDKVSDQIELMTELMKVTSSLKSNVTADYTLAFFNKEEREYITENYQNAEFAKELIARFGYKGYHYYFDEEKGEWLKNSDGSMRKVMLKEEEIKLVNKMADRIFTFFMISAHMMAILNRNKNDNFLVKLLGRHEEEEKPVVFGEDDRSVLQKLKDKITGNEKEKFEEDD